MSTELVLVLVILSVAVAALVSLYRSRAQSELERLNRYEYWADTFFDKSKPLISDADTPSGVLEIIAGLNSLITEPSAPKSLYRVLAHRSYRNSNRQTIVDSEAFECLKRRPELMDSFVEALFAGLMASSYQSRFWGVAARALLADQIGRKQNKAAMLSSEVKEVAEKVFRHRFNHCDLRVA